jgi:hypothetical protein
MCRHWGELINGCQQARLLAGFSLSSGQKRRLISQLSFDTKYQLNRVVCIISLDTMSSVFQNSFHRKELIHPAATG